MSDRSVSPSHSVLAHACAIRGDALFLEGKFAEALEQFEQSVRLQPLVPDYHFRMASAAWRLEKAELVEPGYAEAIRLDPGFAEAHQRLAQWLHRQHDIPRALHHSACALALSPGDADTIVTHGTVLIADGQADAAWELLRPLIDAGSSDGNLAAAYAELAPRRKEGFHAVMRLERALADPRLAEHRRAHLHFAAAGLLDGLGKYDDAFAHARRGNELARRPFNRGAYSAWISSNIQYFTKERLRTLPRATHPSHRPIFIVGMPRSGTSLVEQILATHPDVHGGGELKLLGDISRSILSERSLASALDAFTQAQADQRSGEYLSGIAALNSSAPRVTDKMPGNFELLWLIESLLSGGSIIHCTRDPRDTCLSCYFTDFAEANSFSFDLDDLASYYRDYHRLMEHWKGVITVPMIDVSYEALVADPERATRRLLEFLNLPWDARCLKFHANPRYVATASRDQVRQPLYGSSVGRWKNYEKHLGALLALG